jgi:hypothetical protein|tara:strand:- start:1972 stop:2268 length:297 start_codon:yes stop_codon:yes gene_type:complete
MGNWFVKSFDNYYKFIDDDSSMIILTSASLDESGSDMVISFNHLSESVPKYEDMRDSFLSSSYFTSSYTGSSEPVPQIISESLWEEKKTELKSYIINS